MAVPPHPVREELEETLVRLARDVRPGDDPRLVALTTALRLGREACEAGDHATEQRIAAWRVDGDIDLDAGSRADGWRRLLDAMEHRPSEPADLHQRASEAFDDLASRLADTGASPAVTRQLLDPIARRLRAIEGELGLGPSAPVAELIRRDRVRASRTATGPTFAARHAEDLAAHRAAEARAWYGSRLLDRHGVAPPDDWWLEAADDGGWIGPDAAHLFDAEDHVAFQDETEAAFRADRGLPARGEGWVSATSLARCVQDVLPGVKLQREARMPWLGRQSLDILLPELGVAIEYQGEQHYQPLEHWGGDAGLAARRELDERKRDACARAGIRLLEWRYDEPITVDRVRTRLEDAGLVPPD